MKQLCLSRFPLVVVAALFAFLASLLPGGSKNRGTELHQWGCQRTNKNQMFKWD
jgi:hypothetical protein